MYGGYIVWRIDDLGRVVLGDFVASFTLVLGFSVAIPKAVIQLPAVVAVHWQECPLSHRGFLQSIRANTLAKAVRPSRRTERRLTIVPVFYKSLITFTATPWILHLSMGI